jgi:hypothetical protein
MRRKQIALTVFLLAPIAIVAILTWLIVATLEAQQARSGGAAVDPPANRP